MGLRRSVLARARRHLGTIMVAAVTAMLATGGPAVLAAVTNADTVDGFSARSSTGTPARRANLLIAADAQGYLPNNVIRKVADANKVDGLDSAAFQRRVTDACAVGSTISAIAADGSVTCRADGVDGGNAQTLDGLDSTALARATALTWGTVKYALNTLTPTPGYFQCRWKGADNCNASWTHEGGGWQNAAFAKDPFGFVHLQGVVYCYSTCAPTGSPTDIIFTLPEGYRPAANLVLAGFSGNQAGRMMVNTQGHVIAYSVQNTEDYVSIDGITFPAAP